jgi:hypothetical protein
LYGSCCENKVWYWALFVLPQPHGEATTTSEFYPSAKLCSLVLAIIGSGISTRQHHPPVGTDFLYIMHRQIYVKLKAFSPLQDLNPNTVDLASQKLGLQEFAI